jgi:hypothetical protein
LSGNNEGTSYVGTLLFNLLWRMARLSLVLMLVVSMEAVGLADTAPALTVQVEDRGPAIFSLADFASLPRQTVRARDHRGMELTFDGVLLRDLLAQAGTPVGEALDKDNLTTIVLVTGADEYRVVFSLAELDAGYGAQPVLVVDKVAGLPLKPEHGPWRLVVPEDHRHGRWVRQVRHIQVRRLAQ